MAHHWEVSADGLRWHFYIRSTLHWHDGDKIETAQLQRSLTALLAQPVSRDLPVMRQIAGGFTAVTVKSRQA
ncbi:hypothetical protein [Enterobacter kobei]|uniref:hypothetical protein n=1 Tax=Enterobacter kobei TaxID=208224 RepID=UPI0039C3B698